MNLIAVLKNEWLYYTTTTTTITATVCLKIVAVGWVEIYSCCFFYFVQNWTRVQLLSMWTQHVTESVRFICTTFIHNSSRHQRFVLPFSYSPTLLKVWRLFLSFFLPFFPSGLLSLSLTVFIYCCDYMIPFCNVKVKLLCLRVQHTLCRKRNAERWREAERGKVISKQALLKANCKDNSSFFYLVVVFISSVFFLLFFSHKIIFVFLYNKVIKIVKFVYLILCVFVVDAFHNFTGKMCIKFDCKNSLFQSTRDANNV